MGVKVAIPEKQEETSIGRRLFSMAAPIVGGMFGGPAGAALGSVLGGKVGGASGRDALMSGLQTFGAEKAAGAASPVAKTTADGALDSMPQLQKPEIGDSAVGRRVGALSQNPQMAVAGGLDVLRGLDPTHPLRQELTAPLVKAQYLSQRRIG